MKTYGPYVRKDGRKHLVIIHEDGKRQTKSYPRHVLEQHLGRELTDEETVDHIDGDFTNDSISNLQILSLVDNIRKSHPVKEFLDVICKACGVPFRRELREETRRMKDQKDGPFCSHKCVGKVYH